MLIRHLKTLDTIAQIDDNYDENYKALIFMTTRNKRLQNNTRLKEISNEDSKKNNALYNLFINKMLINDYNNRLNNYKNNRLNSYNIIKFFVNGSKQSLLYVNSIAKNLLQFSSIIIKNSLKFILSMFKYLLKNIANIVYVICKLVYELTSVILRFHYDLLRKLNLNIDVELCLISLVLIAYIFTIYAILPLSTILNIILMIFVFLKKCIEQYGKIGYFIIDMLFYFIEIIDHYLFDIKIYDICLLNKEKLHYICSYIIINVGEIFLYKLNFLYTILYLLSKTIIEVLKTISVAEPIMKQTSMILYMVAILNWFCNGFIRRFIQLIFRQPIMI